MKRSINILLASAIFTLMIVVTIPASAQEPPHPPTSGHGTKGNQPSGTAPIDGGMSLLIAMGIAYGARKMNKK
jgi:hypothetical protein